MIDLSSKTAPVALITGSGRRRIGYWIAKGLAEDGYRIALHYHTSRQRAEQTCDELQTLSPDCAAFKADVTDEDSTKEMVEAVIDRFGRIDVLVTTASVWDSISLEKTTAADVRKSFEVNTLGTWLVARDVGLQMARQQTGGSIVTFGDSAVARPYIDHSAYFLAKGSIATLTRTMAVELGHRNPKVRVNCIDPGPVLFPPDTTSDQQQALREETIVKDGDCPEMVVDAVRFLNQNTFVTGACIPIDGGKHCYTPEGAIRSQ